MDLGLSGKVIIVTGGGSGIGAAVSEVLAEEGAVPVILTRRAPDAAWLKGVTRADVVLADLSDDAQCRRAVTEIRTKHRKIDGLVAGIMAIDEGLVRQ